MKDELLITPRTLYLARALNGRIPFLFFESGWLRPPISDDQVSGNPVKFGDGSATVTDHKLPQPLCGFASAIRMGRREGGSESGVRISI